MFRKCAQIGLSLLVFCSALSMAQEANYRLTDKVVPTFQQISLTVDPDSPVFNGETTIDIKVTESTDTVEFYQLELNIIKAELLDGNKTIPLSVSSHEYDIQHAKAAQQLSPKNYKLHIIFSGKVNTTSDGMYLAKFEGNNYLYTQFEDMHARRAFPSFDEPAFKIPFQLSITAPQKHTVLANTLVNKRTVKDGWQTVQFNKTKPMPTYIVAYAIGEFDSADIPGLKVPGKIYTPKGQASRTKFVAKNTAGILASLERYFGFAYPYEKLDFIAVPNFTHGAMENAGLVTYRSSLLLLDDEPSLTEQQAPLNVVAHELAHMWYGNVVTMAWWDDLWLNEAFASWMATKVLLELYPEQNVQAQLVQEGAFAADSSPTTKPVKKIVKSQTDVMDGLGLNYSKGESILQMIEALVGEQAFQKGIQHYMQANKWGNATADDLWAALATVADFDVPALMMTYLEQPAYPLVEFSNDGLVNQSRYHLLGATVKEQVWTVPLAITYKKNGKINRTQVFMHQKSMNLPELAEAQWIFPNDNALGYMRWKVPTAQLNALLNDVNALNVREKKSLLYNTEALFSAGKVELSEYMAVLNVLAGDQDPIVGSAVAASFRDLDYLVDDSNRAMFGQFAEHKLLPWFKRLGVTERKTDSADERRLRSAVYGVLAHYSDNAEVKAISQQLASRYLAEPGRMPRAMALVALRNVSRFADQTWFEKLKSTYSQNTDANVQGVIASAMKFEQPELVRSTLDFALTDNVSPANVISFVAGASALQPHHDVLYQWLEQHFDQLAKKMPAYHIVRLPEYASAGCSQHDIDSANAFYAPRQAKIDGMQRSLDVAIERTQQCAALKASNQATFNSYLQSAL